jgi:hypothetical protein
MSGNNEGKFRRNTNALSTTWTKARIASTTREVEWTFENTKPSVSFDGKTLHDKHRRNVLSSIRISQKARHMTRLCEMPSQGKAMECVATDPASSHFFQIDYIVYDIRGLEFYTPCKITFIASKRCKKK